MPIYEYHCDNCDTTFEKLIRSISKKPQEIHCPTCESIDVERLISSVAFHKGGGGATAELSDDSTSIDTPPVFGRKELEAATEKKRQIKEQIAAGE